MKSVKFFYTAHCPACEKTKKAILELRDENPKYEMVQLESISEEEHPELAELFDHDAVPCIFYGDEKLYEAQPGQNYEEIKNNIRKAFDRILSDKTELQFNDEMTEAMAGAYKRAIRWNKLMAFDEDYWDEWTKKFDEEERFYGTVPDEEALKKLKRANELLDILSTHFDMQEIQQFEQLDSLYESVIVEFTSGKLSIFQGPTKKAFAELAALADTVSLQPSGEGIRVMFSFRNVWKEHREMTDEEYKKNWGFDINSSIFDEDEEEFYTEDEGNDETADL